MRRLAVFMTAPESDAVIQARLQTFKNALQALGWAEGGNLRVDTRWWGGADINRMRALAQELVGLQPDIILVTGGLPATVAIQRATRTIPVVFVGGGDPVASGLVARLDQPGGNITGFANWEPSMGGKWLELLSEITPGLKRVATMFNPAPLTARLLCPHLRRRPGHSRSCRSLRPFIATKKSKRGSAPLGASREAAFS
jgi:putative ABC transport system substrate-binding protein